MRYTHKIFFIVGLIAILFVSGCNAKKPAKETETMIPEIDEQMVLKLRNEAIEKYYVVFSEGGEQCSTSLDERLADPEEYYYYYCSDLDSKEKIKEYLKGSYTEAIVDQMLDTDAIKTINGKLAYLPSDVGSMLEWEKAEVVQIKDDQNKKEIEFRVPDVDGVVEIIKIQIVYEERESGGWRIDTYPLDYL